MQVPKSTCIRRPPVWLIPLSHIAWMSFVSSIFDKFVHGLRYMWFGYFRSLEDTSYILQDVICIGISAEWNSYANRRVGPNMNLPWAWLLPFISRMVYSRHRSLWDTQVIYCALYSTENWTIRCINMNIVCLTLRTDELILCSQGNTEVQISKCSAAGVWRSFTHCAYSWWWESSSVWGKSFIRQRCSSYILKYCVIFSLSRGFAAITMSSSCIMRRIVILLQTQL